jgi:Fe2+ transport system protein FeoA
MNHQMQMVCLIDDLSVSDTTSQMQTRVNKGKSQAGHAGHSITALRRGEAGILDRIELPEPDARRLMEMGFLPGHTVVPARSAPGGDPRVYQVDGSEIALRKETARHLILR